MRIFDKLRRHWPFWSVLIVILAAFLISENTFSKPFKECIQYVSSEQSANSSHKSSFIVANLTVRQGICTVQLVSRHNGFFTLLSTIFVAFFTYTLWKTSSEQGALTRESIDLARQEFITSHRPRLRIRRVTFESICDGRPVEGYLTVSNIGDTPATIIQAGVDVFTRYSVSQSGIGFAYSNSVPKDIIPVHINTGETVKVDFRSVSPLTHEEMNQADAGELEIMSIGQILYVDEIKTKRTVGFIRAYNVNMNRFLPLSDSDPDKSYEYED